jgi:hypothetical protein
VNDHDNNHHKNKYILCQRVCALLIKPSLS